MLASVDPRALPKLIVRSQACYSHDTEMPRSVKSLPGGIGTIGGGSSGTGSGGGRLSGGSSPKPGKRPPPPPPNAPPVPADGSGYGYSAEDDTGSSKRAEAAAPSEARTDGPAADKPQPQVIPLPQQDDYHAYGATLYLSNDDSMSLSSAQRVIYAIDRFLPIPREHVRPHELLNYFSFEATPHAPGYDFSVLGELQPKPGAPGTYTLGFSVSGRASSPSERRNAALTFVIDRSGSMSDEGRMDYLKHGLLRMTSELKSGDLVNLVLFDDSVCVPIENFVVGRDAPEILTSAVRRLEPRGSTDVHLGLQRGYALADGQYQSTHENRVVLITDALTNTGVTDEESIALVAKHYDERRIRLSGVGVGSDFNDSLLDRLTERGGGAYVFLGSEAEVEAVFGRRFGSLIETIANDVHFRLSLPPSLGMQTFYGEESSTRKEDVLPIHYFSGTRQMFLSDVVARGGRLRPQDTVMLSVEFKDPETGAARQEEFAFVLGEMLRNTRNVQKARLVLSFIDGVRDTAHSEAERAEPRRGGWRDVYASRQCAAGRTSLAEQAVSLSHDPEVKRVLSLWETYCARYEALLVPKPPEPRSLDPQPPEPHRTPQRRQAPTGAEVWPSAER